ncbi:MAG: hypothetical protein PUC29_04325, partial [Clostridia bacterium]|nr:hypothetical protein [Clostridia bacterium]
MLEKTDVLFEFAKEHEETFKGIMKVFKDFLNRLKNAIKKLAGDKWGNSDEARLMSDYYTELAEVYKTVAKKTFEALSNAANSGENTKSAENKKAPAGEKVQNSRKHSENTVNGGLKSNKFSKLSVDTALYESLDHRDSGDDNLILVSQMPRYITNLLGISGDFYIYRNHAYENMKTKEEAINDGRYNENAHYHGLGVEKMSEAILSIENPLATIASSTQKGTPMIEVILPVFDENGDPLYGVLKFYSSIPINGLYRYKPHVLLTISNRPMVSKNDGRKTTSEVINSAIESGNLIDARIEKREELSVIAQHARLGNITRTSLDNNLSRFVAKVKAFKEKNRIDYSRKSGRSSVYHAYEIMDLFGIKKTAENRDTVAGVLEQIVNAARMGGADVFNDGVSRDMAMKAAEFILPEVKKQRRERAQTILDEILGTKVFIDEYQLQKINSKYGNWEKWSRGIKKYIFPMLSLDKDVRSLNQMWQEWSEQYPDFFDAGVVGGDQATRLYEIIKTLKNDYVPGRISQEDVASFAEYLLRIIKDEVQDGESPISLIDALAKTANSEEDFKAISEYRALQREIGELRKKELSGDEKAGDRIEEIERKLLKLRSTQVFRDLIIRQNERARRDIQSTMLERDRARREKVLRSDEMRRIVKIKDSLDRAAAHPTKGKYIPADIKKSYAELVRGMDAVTYDVQKYIDDIDRKIAKLDLRIEKATDGDVISQLKQAKKLLTERREKYISRRDTNSRRLGELAAM